MGGLPILVSRFRGTRPGNPRESVKKDRPSTQRFVMVPAHVSPMFPSDLGYRARDMTARRMLLMRVE
jgi:hypothetical protein